MSGHQQNCEPYTLKVLFEVAEFWKYECDPSLRVGLGFAGSFGCS